MAKQGVRASDARVISRRLKELAGDYGSWAKFIRRLGIKRTTANAWARHRRLPSVPEVALLIHIARETNVSLDWLLLGEGNMLREKEADTPIGRVF